MNANIVHDGDSFQPLWPFHSGWAQTIVANFLPQWGLRHVDGMHHLTLADHDQIVVCENAPQGWLVGQRIACIVHGLTGSAFSKDSTRLARILMKQGLRVVRVNLRNAGPGFGLAKRYYNAGCSDDLRSVLQWLATKYPGSPVTQIGFSLGGNASLKLAGEDGANPSGNLDSVIAVCPPADLGASSQKLERPENRLFNRYFSRRMVQHIDALCRIRPGVFRPKMPKNVSLKGFDDLYTAPLGGFQSADEYYRKSSAIGLISKITVPTLILGAMDDPVVATEALLDVDSAPHRSLWLTKRGGHCGYLGFGGDDINLRWMDAAIVKWMLVGMGFSERARTT